MHNICEQMRVYREKAKNKRRNIVTLKSEDLRKLNQENVNLMEPMIEPV